MDVQCAPYHNTDMSGSVDQQRRGFHTFVMTGDAIIRTNFNPFKPTRQLSHDPVPPKKNMVTTERSLSNIENHRHDIQAESENNNTQTEDSAPSPATPHRCVQDKQFIPGFIRVDDRGELSGYQNKSRRSLNYTEDSGIDIQLSDNDADNQADKQLTVHSTKSAKHKHAATKHLKGDRLAQQANQSDTEVGIEYHQETAAHGNDELSAKQLATRLYQLDGYELSDVCRYLSKSDDFHEKVALEFLSYFDFTGHSLVDSLRTFLSQVSLDGEVEEREVALHYFTSRYLQCNPQQTNVTTFQSEDSCHTLVCALVLLNEDLHNSPYKGKERTTLKLFSENLSQLNGGIDFPQELLKDCFDDIDNQPIVSSEEDLKRRFSESINYGIEPLPPSEQSTRTERSNYLQLAAKRNDDTKLHPELEEELSSGYVLIKHCKGPKAIKMPSRKRGWRRRYAMIRDMKLLMFKSERGAPSVSAANRQIELDNVYATVATHYKKRKHALMLTCSDGAEYLIVTGDHKEMDKWIHSINLIAAVYSKPEEVRYRYMKPMQTNQPPLGSVERMREQLTHYETQVRDAGDQLLVSENLPETGATKQNMRQFSQNQLQHQLQLQKFTAYVTVLKAHLEKFRKATNHTQQKSDPINAQASHESKFGAGIEIFSPGNRISYRQAVYGQSDADHPSHH